MAAVFSYLSAGKNAYSTVNCTYKSLWAFQRRRVGVRRVTAVHLVLANPKYTSSASSKTTPSHTYLRAHSLFSHLRSRSFGSFLSFVLH